MALTQAYVVPNIYAIAGQSGRDLPFGVDTIGILGKRDLSWWGQDSGRNLTTYPSPDAAADAALTGCVGEVGDHSSSWQPYQDPLPEIFWFHC